MLYGILFLFFAYFIFLTFFSGKPDKETQEAHENLIKEVFDFTTKKAHVIEHLPYIVIEDSDVMFFNTLRDIDVDIELLDKIDHLIEVSNSKLIHLSNDMSNRELRKKYGYNNFNTLLECDTRFKEFLDLLYTISFELVTHRKEELSIKLLEVGIKYNTDLNYSYILLGSLYKKENKLKELKNLIDIIRSRNYLSKDKILKAISNM